MDETANDPHTDEGPGLFGDMVQPKDADYRVLARKYRPQRFEDLIGQEAMVRTLRNAFALGRIHHAFMLTGVRGVGKTTTARIIARALNYEPFDKAKGPAGPTVDLAVPGVHCAAIAESRHPDVQEMDAASRTGINDIRELIEGVRYAPVSARTKVYIVDEVHMLSTQAFNGLLKTLEEPPPHVVFIFATTEIRKVPVTVLSRCQRFDLKRVDRPTLSAHLMKVVAAEKAQAEDAAIALIARAAEGSVRDALSLLDQAIAQGDGRVGVEQVRDMLGLADRERTVGLFERIMKGETVAALDELAEQIRGGAEPVAVLQDLAGVVHQVTKAKLVGADGSPTDEPAAARIEELGQSLAMPHLARAWQMLLKGIAEVQGAPDPFAAAEMVVIRLAHVSDLPTPEEIVRTLKNDGGAPPVRQPASAPPAPAQGPRQPPRAQSPAAQQAVHAAPARTAPEAQAPPPKPDPATFEAVIALAEARGELRLARELKEEVHIVRFDRGRIEFTPTPAAPGDLAGRLGKALLDWTGARWVVSLSDAGGAPTVRNQRIEAEKLRRAEVARDPLVKAILDTFPGAQIAEIRERADEAPPAMDPDVTIDPEPDDPGTD